MTFRPLSDAQLTQARAVQTMALTDLCRVLRKTETIGEAGGRKATWAVQVNDCKGRIGNAGRSSEERIVAERIAPKLAYTITLPYGSDALPGDRIEFPSAWPVMTTPMDKDDGRSFEVVSVLRPTLETARRCVCFEVL